MPCFDNSTGGSAAFNGTAENPVYFGPPPDGQWDGIEIGDFNGTVVIDHAIIDKAFSGITLNGRVINPENSKVLISDSLIKDYVLYSVLCVNNAEQIVLLRNVTEEPETGSGLDPGCGFDNVP